MPTLNFSKEDLAFKERPLKLVEISGQKWVVGFNWLNRDPRSKFSQADLRRFLSRQNFNFWSWQKDQIGLGHSQSKELLKARALAPWVALGFKKALNKLLTLESKNKALEVKDFSLALKNQDILALMPLTTLDGASYYWLYAQQKGHLVPGFSDALFKEREEGEQAVSYLLQFFKWGAENRCYLEIDGGKSNSFNISILNSCSKENRNFLLNLGLEPKIRLQSLVAPDFKAKFNGLGLIS